MRYIFDEPNCKFATKIETQAHLQRLMKRSIRTEGIHLSSNITCQNLLSINFCSPPYVMLVPRTLITDYQTLESLKKLMAKAISIMLQELTITQNIW